jgi:hypothetical protein
MQQSGTYRRLYDLQFGPSEIEQRAANESEFAEAEAL